MESTEDEKVSTDDLQEKIAEFEDYVQSSDIAAMQSTQLTSVFSNALLIYADRTLSPSDPMCGYGVL